MIGINGQTVLINNFLHVPRREGLQRLPRKPRYDSQGSRNRFERCWFLVSGATDLRRGAE